METIAIVLALSGVLAVSSRDVIQRLLLRDKTFSEKEILVFQWAFMAVVLASVWLLSGNVFSSSSSNSTMFWLGVILVTAANFFIQPALVRAKKLGEASLVAPVMALTPGLLTVAAIIFVSERPTWQGLVGIGLIMVGNYAHLREGAKTLKEWLLPFSWLFLPANHSSLLPEEQAKVLQNRSALRWAYLGAVLGTFGLIGEALTVRGGDLALGFAIQATALSICFSLMSFGQGSQTTSFSIRWQEHKKLLLAVGIFSVLHVVLMGLAFRLAPVAYIGSLKRLSIVVVVILSIFILKETKAKKRLWPAMIVTLGAMLLAFDGGIEHIISLIEKGGWI